MEKTRRKSGKKIVIAGAGILDVLVSPAGPEVFATGSSPAEEICISMGGDALNEATVLAALGGDVMLETVLGRDVAGDMIAGHCREKGIRLRDSVFREGLATGVNVVLVQENGERSFLTSPHGSLRALRSEDIRGPLPEDAGIFCFASMFVSPHIGPAELAALFCSLKEQGVTVCADMTKRKNGETAEQLAPALQYVDFLFGNEEEIRLLTGKETVEEGAEVLECAGAGQVTVKCGSRGCYVRSRDVRGRIPAEAEVNCVDTTGAGDSFVAGFLYGLSRGAAPDACLRLALWCGARAVEKVGATAWTEDPEIIRKVPEL